MSTALQAPAPPIPSPRANEHVLIWREHNAAYMYAQMERIRLLLKRRALWVRVRWGAAMRDAASVDEAQLEAALAPESEAAEAAFYKRSAEVRELDRRIDAAKAEIEEGGDAMAQEAAPGIVVLQQMFGLSALERDALLLVFGAEIDDAFARAFAYASDNPARSRATPRLVLDVLCNPGPSRLVMRDIFLPHRPLRRARLLEDDTWTPGSPTLAIDCPLRLESRVADFLRGVDRLDDRLAPFLRPTPSPLLAAEHERIAERVREHLTAKRDTWAVVNLIDEANHGGREIAAAACQRAGAMVYDVDIARVAAEPFSAQLTLAALLARDAVMSRLVYLADTTTIDSGDSAARRVVTDLADRLAAPLIVLSRERRPSSGETLALRVPKLTRITQVQLWRRALGVTSETITATLDDVAQQFDFGPSRIARAADAAREHAAARGAPAVCAVDLWDACREQHSAGLGDVARRIEPCYDWADLVLPRRDLAQLRDLATQVQQRARVYESWGFGEQLSRGRGITALFAGASGTGKTMAAEVLAKHLRLDLYRIDLSAVVSKWVGETEKKLRLVFDAAEEQGVIVFFDEADALFTARTEVRDSHDRYANLEVNYLLQRMEDYTGLAILATNRRSALDEGFIRRLRFVVDFPFPDVDSRRRMWEQAFPRTTATEDLDWSAIARLELSGGNIRAIAIAAAFLAAGENSPVRMIHVMRAAAREYGKLQKVVSATEFGPYFETVRS